MINKFAGMKPLVRRGILNLVRTCAGVRRGERVLVIADTETQPIGRAVFGEVLPYSSDVALVVVPPLRDHGQEPPPQIAEAMRKSDVVFALTRMSMAHTKARLAATKCGTRYLSLPDYSDAVLASDALAAKFPAISVTASRLAKRLTAACRILVRTNAGTDIEFSVSRRVGNSAPGTCLIPGQLASPPDAEVNVSIVENSSNGVLVVDGSIPCPELGVLEKPITLSISNGKVVSFAGRHSAILRSVFSRVHNPRAYILAEFGIGLNPKAKLCGRMLEDEGAIGTCHFGIGSNSTIGGKNSVPFHLDHVIKFPTITADRIELMRSGSLSAAVFD